MRGAPMKTAAAVVVAMALIGAVVARDLRRPAPISIKLTSEFLPGQWVHVNFYEDMFTGLYQCMSSNNSLTCAGDLARDEKQPFAASDRRVVSLDKPELSRPSEIHSDYFSCEFDFPKDIISCRRLDSADRGCDAHSEAQLVRILANDSSLLKCVGFLWQSHDESLIFDQNVHRIQLCNGTCNVTSTGNASHVNNDHERPSWDQSQGRDNVPHWGNPRILTDQFHDRKAQIIIAVVASIGVAVILIVAAGIFRRKILQMKAPPKASTIGEVGGKKKTLNRKVSSSSRTFSIHTAEKPSRVILNPRSLYSDI